MNTKNEKTDYSGGLISRVNLAGRWDCSYRTIIRREKRGELVPIVFSGKMIRYSMEDVKRVELEHKYLLANTEEVKNV
jgi:hypothetical protein